MFNMGCLEVPKNAIYQAYSSAQLSYCYIFKQMQK